MIVDRTDGNGGYINSRARNPRGHPRWFACDRCNWSCFARTILHAQAAHRMVRPDCNDLADIGAVIEQFNQRIAEAVGTPHRILGGVYTVDVHGTVKV